MEPGSNGTGDAVGDVPPGAAALTAFARLMPAVSENWELEELAEPIKRGDHRPDLTHILRHKTCGAEWKTDSGKFPENVVCYSCGKK